MCSESPSRSHWLPASFSEFIPRGKRRTSTRSPPSVPSLRTTVCEVRLANAVREKSMNLKFLFIALDCARVIRRFGFRSALILLASALGIGGVIVCVNFAAGGRREALNQIARMGVNAITVVPQQDRGAAGRVRTGGIAHTLLPPDYAGIRQLVPAIIRSSAIASGEFRIKAGDLSKSTQIVGCEPGYPAIKNWA